MSDEARKRLRANIKTVGLLETLVWNRRTGNLVSGHQRLSALDALEGKKDYFLTVAAVDLDDATEKAQNVFMNNPLSQGDWDIDKLGEMFGGGMDADGAGFDAAEVYQLFGDSPKVKAELLGELAEDVRRVNDRVEKIAQKISNHRDDPDFFLVVVFDSADSRKKLTDALQTDDNRFVDARVLLAAMGKAPKDAGRLEPAADLDKLGLNSGIESELGL